MKEEEHLRNLLTQLTEQMKEKYLRGDPLEEMISRSNSATMQKRHDVPSFAEKYRFSDDVRTGKASEKYADVYDNQSPPVQSERRKPSSREQHKSPQRASTSNFFTRSRSPSRPRMMSHPAASSSSGQRSIPMSKFELLKNKTPEKISRQGISQGATARSSSRPVTASPCRKKAIDSPTRKANPSPTRKVMASPNRRSTASPIRKKIAESPTRKVIASPSRRSTASPSRKSATSPVRKASFSPRRQLPMSPSRKSKTSVEVQSANAYHTSHQDSIKGTKKNNFRFSGKKLPPIVFNAQL